jgi:hypothetical protein
MTRSNWVTRRLADEKAFPEQARKRWDEVLFAIEDACDSYRIAHPGSIGWRRDNGKRIHVTKDTFDAHGQAIREGTLIVSYDVDKRAIVVTDDGESLQLPIMITRQGVSVVHDGQPVNAERASEIILEGLFFQPRK